MLENEDAMTDDEREELIYSLLNEFRDSIGSVTDEQKYAFIAGARSALVTGVTEEQKMTVELGYIVVQRFHDGTSKRSRIYWKEDEARWEAARLVGKNNAQIHLETVPGQETHGDNG